MNLRPDDPRERIQHLEVNISQWQEFQHHSRHLCQLSLSKRPYTRLVIAEILEDVLGKQWTASLCEAIDDPSRACVLIKHPVMAFEHTLKYATAIAHLLGHAAFDQISSQYFAAVDMKSAACGDSYLTEPYHDLRLHTDGTFYPQAIDWLVLAKTRQRGVSGGELSLHHVHDIENIEILLNEAIAKQDFEFKASPSKKVSGSHKKPLFYQRSGAIAMRFSDQFCHPDSRKQALFLHKLSYSLELSPKRIIHPFEEGTLLILNNHFWLHGRQKLHKTTAFERQLLRLRGSFYQANTSQVA